MTVNSESLNPKNKVDVLFMNRDEKIRLICVERMEKNERISPIRKLAVIVTSDSAKINGRQKQY